MKTYLFINDDWVTPYGGVSGGLCGGGLALARLESRYNADSLRVNGNVLENKYKCGETLKREGSENVSLKPFRFGALYYLRGEDLFCHLAS